MSKEFVAVVTEGMLDKAWETSAAVHEATAGKVFLAMTKHPDFQRQVRAYAAAVARGLVRKRQVADRYDDDGMRWEISGYNACRAETLAAIDRWEKGETAPTNQERGNGSITEDTK